jgi:hypothetical protein
MRALAILVLVTACNGFDAPAQPVSRAHPIANAGTGSSYALGATVTLDGSQSFDPGGTITEYRWTIAQRPNGSTAMPADLNSAVTTFVPDQFGTYRLQLKITDDAQNTDASEVRIVATGAIASIDAGPDATVSWLDTAQLAGTVSLEPGQTASYSWSFMSRPPGSMAALANATTLNPTFVADAAGTYVIALDAAVGDEAREDTVMIEATHGGVALGAGGVAYVYAKRPDRIVFVRDVGHAEVVQVDPMTGTQLALDVGAFTPRSLSIDLTDQLLAVGGLGTVATVALTISPFVLTGTRSVPGCTAQHVTMPFEDRVDCFPADGTVEPISSVEMSTGVVTQVPCPVQFPDVAITPNGWMYMVDSASSQFYLYDSFATPVLPVLQHGSLAGITAPVIAAGTNQPFAVTGNGLGIDPDVTLRFDLHVPISIGAFSDLRYELAVVSGTQLMVFGMEPGQPLKLSVVLPSINGMAPTPKLVGYSSDEHRLIVVVGTADGDIAYTVPR